MAPLKLTLGTDPRTPLSLAPPSPEVDASDQAKRANELLERAQASQDQARGNAERAQTAQQMQANKFRRPVDFGRGEWVYLRKRGFRTDRPTTRLDNPWAGPFKIREERGFSFALDLPATFRGKNLFHADRLRKAAMDPLPGQRQDPPEPEMLDGKPEWEVEEVLSARVSRGKLQYKVRWKGCDPDEDWYSASNFKNAAATLRRFHTAHPEKAGPPKRLEDWLLAAAVNRFDEDHEDNDRPEKKGTSERTRRH